MSGKTSALLFTQLLKKQFSTLKIDDFCFYSSLKASTLKSVLICSVHVPQRSNILSHIWTSEDVWPASVCQDFILEWAAELQGRLQVTSFHSIFFSCSEYSLLY